MAPHSCTVELPGEPPKGHGRVRRNYQSPDKLVDSPEEGVNTLVDIVERGARLFPNRNAMGWRDQIKIHNVEKDVTTKVKGKETTQKKTWQYYEMGPYQYKTYRQVYDRALEAGAGLRHLGISKDTMFNICSTTKPEWMIMAFACATQSITFATAYDSLGEEGLEHSIKEPEVVGIFTNPSMLPTLGKVVSKTPSLKLVIYDGKPEGKAQEALETIAKANGGIKVVTLDELYELGVKNTHEPTKPSPDDTACIMYTSGSTGAPKGVIIAHRNMVASVGAVMINLGDLFKPGMSYMAYLPLAHILELVVEITMYYIGITMGYGTVKTLTDNSVKNCAGDIREFKPSILVGVPAVWELIRKGILTKVTAGGGLKSKMFHGALKAKQASPSLLGPITDAVVFKAVKQATGGRLQYGVSGGAAISRETQTFLNTALVPMLQGYGLTESCGMCAVMHPNYPGFGSVGLTMPSVEVKLVDVEDAKYFVTNNPPQGEVWIRGNSVFKGYYKRDDLTKEAITDDGWFQTGDIGQWNADGTLSLIDRKKNLVKLAGGEYIALERLESSYKSCGLVSNICLHADPNANKPMAIVFPHEANLKAAGKQGGWASDNEDVASM